MSVVVAARATTPHVALPTRAPVGTGVAPREPGTTAATVLRWARRVTVAGWLGWAAFVVWGISSGSFSSVGELQELLGGLGLWAPLAYVLLGASEAVVPVVPGSVTLVAGPLLFGPVVGTLAAYAATCLGSTAVFLLSRHVGTDLVRTRFRPATVERYLGWLGHRHFARWFAVAIALPVAPDDLLCYLAGMSGMRLRTFLTIILLLKPFSLVLYTVGVLALVRQLGWAG